MSDLGATRPPPSPGDGLRRAFTENLGLKALSLAAALALFSLVRVPQSADAESRRTFMVNVITTVDVPPESRKVLVTDFPPEVRLTLQGSRFLLSSIEREDIQTDVTLSDPTQTLRFFEPSDFSGIPAGVTLSEVEPASVALVWDNQVSQSLPVEPALAGEPGDGLALAETIRVDPPQVRATGPQRDVPTESLRTAPIRISNLGAGEHRRTVPLAVVPTSVTFEPASVEVILTIEPERRVRSFEDMELIALGPQAEARPSTVDVAVTGPPNVVDAIDPETIIPTVDATEPGLTGTVEREVTIRGLPDGVSVSMIQPRFVFLTFAR